AGLVLPPERQGGRYRRLVHGGGAGERRTLTRKETTMTKRAGLTAAVVLTLSLLGPAVRADVMPGDKITDQNMDKAKDLMSPGMEWCVKRGFPMTIVEPKRIEWPKAYKEATEKYSGQVKLAPDGLSVQNFVAGQPFPTLDPTDPQIALQAMWHSEHKC